MQESENQFKYLQRKMENILLNLRDDQLPAKERTLAVSLFTSTSYFKSQSANNIHVSSYIPYIIDGFKIERFPPGSMIFSPDHQVWKLFYIMQGTVREYAPKSADELISEVESARQKKLIERKSTGCSPSRATISGHSRRQSQNAFDYHQKMIKTLEKNDQLLVARVISEDRKNAFSLLTQGVMKIKPIRDLRVGDIFGADIFQDQIRVKQYLTIAADEVIVMSIDATIIKDAQRLVEQEIRMKDLFFQQVLESASSEVKSIAEGFSIRDFEKNQVIFKEGEESQGFFIFDSGEVNLYRRKHKNNDLSSTDLRNLEEIASLSRGNVFGEEVFLNSNTRSYTAIAGDMGANCYYVSNHKYKQLKASFSSHLVYLKQKIKSHNFWIKLPKAPHEAPKKQVSALSTLLSDQNLNFINANYDLFKSKQLKASLSNKSLKTINNSFFSSPKSPPKQMTSFRSFPLSPSSQRRNEQKLETHPSSRGTVRYDFSTPTNQSVVTPAKKERDTSGSKSEKNLSFIFRRTLIYPDPHSGSKTNLITNISQDIYGSNPEENIIKPQLRPRPKLVIKKEVKVKNFMHAATGNSGESSNFKKKLTFMLKESDKVPKSPKTMKNSLERFDFMLRGKNQIRVKNLFEFKKEKRSSIPDIKTETSDELKPKFDETGISIPFKGFKLNRPFSPRTTFS